MTQTDIMKNLRYILLSAVALVTQAGCDKWIDNAKTPSTRSRMTTCAAPA